MGYGVTGCFGLRFTLNNNDVAVRRLLFAVATVAALLGIYVMVTILAVQMSARTDWTAVQQAQGTITIIKVQPGSTEWKAGFRAGDVIGFARQAWPARAWILKPYARTPVTFIVERDGTFHSLSVTFSPGVLSGGLASLPKINGMLGIGVLWMVAFAFFVASRRPDSAQARAICWILLAYAIGDSFLNFLSPIPALNVLSILCGEPGIVLSATLFSLFALHFIASSPARKLFEYAALLMLAVSILFSLGAVCAIFFGWPNPASIAEMIQRVPVKTVARWPGIFTNEFHFLAQRTLALFCGAWAIMSTRGQVRARVGWATAALALLYGTTMLSQPFVFAGVITPAFANDLVDWGVFLVPVGLTYAVMSRRFLDTGYVMNRATVFSVVSLLLVGSFVLIEWFLTGWLHDAGRATNILVSAAVALALGLSARFVHTRVDNVVDNVFFRKRHEDEAALRTFAREAPYITDRDALLARTSTLLERHADATFARVLCGDESGHYGSLSENDPAIVRLRATHRAVDLHGADSELEGEIAYPMVARGRLVGVLVLGPKISGESYAPDESSAIAQLAQSVGGALDVLAARADDSAVSLRESIAALVEIVASLRDALNASSRA